MSAATDAAVEAFRVHERHRFLADRSARDLELAVARASVQDGNLADYAEQTAKILTEFDAKREKAGL